MSKAHAQALAFAANPPARVKFTPTPHKLVHAARSRSYNGAEMVHSSMGEALAGMPFDDWHRGDLLVIKRTFRSYHQKGELTESADWYVARRFTTPACKRQLHAVSESTDDSRPVTHETPMSDRDGQVWRITYAWLQAASKLIGKTFESREALELALTETV